MWGAGEVDTIGSARKMPSKPAGSIQSSHYDRAKATVLTDSHIFDYIPDRTSLIGHIQNRSRNFRIQKVAS
jgi:hypothetical protein